MLLQFVTVNNCTTVRAKNMLAFRLVSPEIDFSVEGRPLLGGSAIEKQHSCELARVLSPYFSSSAVATGLYHHRASHQKLCPCPDRARYADTQSMQTTPPCIANSSSGGESLASVESLEVPLLRSISGAWRLSSALRSAR